MALIPTSYFILLKKTWHVSNILNTMTFNIMYTLDNSFTIDSSPPISQIQNTCYVLKLLLSTEYPYPRCLNINFVDVLCLIFIRAISIHFNVSIYLNKILLKLRAMYRLIYIIYHTSYIIILQNFFFRLKQKRALLYY